LPGLPPREKTVVWTVGISSDRKAPSLCDGALTLNAPANKIILVTRNYAQLALGIWILLSPWLLGFSSISIMTWSNLIVGIIIILINVWAIFGETVAEEKEPKK